MVIRVITALLFTMTLAACGGNDSKDHKDHVHKDHDRDKGHVHIAPHGGTLVELGDHFANAELKLDAELKTFTLYVLDAHAENAVKIAQSEVEIIVTPANTSDKDRPATPVTISLKAKGNENTGEKVGDTSQFEIPLAALHGRMSFEGVIRTITVKNQTFMNVKFSFKTTPSR